MAHDLQDSIPNNTEAPNVGASEMEVYRFLSDESRHYGNMQFAQMTIWVAVSAGGLYLLFSNEFELGHYGIFFPLLFGLVGMLFLAMNERVCEYWDFCSQRRSAFEAKLGFNSPWFNERPQADAPWFSRAAGWATAIALIPLGKFAPPSPKNPPTLRGPDTRFISNRDAVRGVYLVGIGIFYFLFFSKLFDFLCNCV